ncbi:hypothetical protein D3C78_349020 [compost metagenome]
MLLCWHAIDSEGVISQIYKEKREHCIDCLSLGFCCDMSITDQERKELLYLSVSEAQWVTLLLAVDEECNPI